jgi:DNA-binding GntR family transcriptional regulator
MNAAAEEFNVKLGELSQQLGRRAPIAEQIAESIRTMIMAGDLKPGERIVESRIARSIGVGQPTVREALVTLGHQGLVRRKANQGCVVTSLTRAEICQLIRVRAELETLAVELAVETATDHEIAGLLKITETMKEAGAAHDPQLFFEHDLRFHQALWSLSHNSFLPHLLEQALAPLLAFLFIRNLRLNLHIDLVESAQAHIDMVQAILTRNKITARRVAQEKLMMFADQHLALYD